MMMIDELGFFWDAQYNGLWGKWDGVERIGLEC